MADKITKDMQMVDILTKHPDSKEVLLQFDIDPDEVDLTMTIEEACEEADVDIDEVIDTLNDHIESESNSEDAGEEDE